MPIVRGPAQSVDIANPVNRNHWLAPYLGFWSIGLPGRDRGSVSRELIRQNNGTLTNMNSGTSGWRPNTRPGALGNLLEFDGSDDYATWPVATAAPSNPIPTNGSLAIWVKRLSGSGSLKGIVNFGNSSHYFIAYWYSGSNGFNWQVAHGGTLKGVKPSAAITETNWNHVICTWTSANATPGLFVNGVSVGATDDLGLGIGAGSDAVEIGRGLSSAYCSNMQCDDFMLINRTLTAVEAWQLYESSRCGHPGLINRIPSALSKGSAVAAAKFRRTLYNRTGSRGAA